MSDESDDLCVPGSFRALVAVWLRDAHPQASDEELAERALIVDAEVNALLGREVSR